MEVDENQHMFGYGSTLSCDMKRMSKVMASIAFESLQGGDLFTIPLIFWLRYNPNAWHMDGVLQNRSKVSREEWLCRLLSNLEVKTELTIGYAFYDTVKGCLEVLNNTEYHPQMAKVAIDLTEYV